MKKPFITMALVLFAMAAQAQTSFKIHNSGQLSLQSSTTSYGIQIPTNGVMSIEPNITSAYGIVAQTKARHRLAMAWAINQAFTPVYPVAHTVYVLGNGTVFAYTGYFTYSSPGFGSKNHYPIEGASRLVSSMKGYYLDSNEFEGVTMEDLEDNPNIAPEALEGILKDIENGKTVGMHADELEAILPEAVRHDPDGGVGINYDAIIPVLVEAFKEQQARIDQLEAIIRENNLRK